MQSLPLMQIEERTSKLMLIKEKNDQSLKFQVVHRTSFQGDWRDGKAC